MKEAFLKYWPAGLTLLFGLGVWFFWAVPFAAVLSYQEQYQLFLSTWGYFVERLSVPGGLVDYAGEWITQWAHYPVLGGLMFALVIVLTQVLTWLICKRLGAERECYALTFIPALLLWRYLCGVDIFISFGLSFAGALGLMLAYECVSRRWVRIALLALCTPVGYWLFGPSVAVSVAYVAVREVLRGPSLASVGLGVGLVVYYLVVVIGSSYVVAYPLDRLFAGLVYHQFPEHELGWQIAQMVVAALLPVVIWKLAGRVKVKGLAWAAVAVVGAGGYFIVRSGILPTAMERLDYDYLVRTEQWDAIIEKAEEKSPSLQSTVSALNLALAQKGELLERMFDFYQNGVNGLLPKFSLNMVAPVMPAEVFFRLGMVNECEYYMFEAQEAMPNYKRSGRLTQRIAECEIINGKYDLARKQLALLEKSPLYRKWAKDKLNLIKNERLVNEHPLYGQLRRMRQNIKDVLFTEAEIDKMIGLLFLSSKANKMAYEYLMAYEMLNADMKCFMIYFPLMRHLDYQRLPKSIQEVLIGNWRQTHGSLKDFKFPYDNYIAQNTLNYIRTYSANHNDPRLDQPPFSCNALNFMLRGKSQTTLQTETSGTVY